MRVPSNNKNAPSNNESAPISATNSVSAAEGAPCSDQAVLRGHTLAGVPTCGPEAFETASRTYRILEFLPADINNSTVMSFGTKLKSSVVTFSP